YRFFNLFIKQIISLRISLRGLCVKRKRYQLAVIFMNKSGSARLATYGLRLAMPGGPMLPRKAAVLIGHSTAVGDKGNTTNGVSRC
ncbi:hypothetical protein, partial [Oceanobacillus caeni]